MLRVKVDLQKLGKGWNQGGKTAKRWGRKNPAIVFAQRNPKEIKKILRVQVVARRATAAPPLGPTLGQYGIPIMKFCEQFNEITRTFKRGVELVVLVKQTYDLGFYFDIMLPTTSVLLKRVGFVTKGSGQAGQIYTYYTLGDITHNYFATLARHEREAADPNAEANKKYSTLVLKKRRRLHKHRSKQEKRSFHTKHKNVIGQTRFAVYTPQMLYEVCILKYVQYLNGGVDVLDFNTDTEQSRVEPRIVPVFQQYLKMVRTFEKNEPLYYFDVRGSYNITTYVMQSLWRMFQGTMRSMGLFVWYDDDV